ncbi:hypothetical protein A1O7_09580 [Cladophialophora yegresii CBS 114405]|uniref:Methyltransferase domain-containing protein n=1 Tax=Cladophialophora yegresii CBS 114405 TaxID=1182544 RepID=W9VFH7_9EURO|nr:uncharacterized protein A1O7_09580 [Cladophialophora yegresii CBS 114405]EXJ54243.1 hypothetical protein A1O7_09580 [Cladophialophora yegresii CBS 114405]
MSTPNTSDSIDAALQEVSELTGNLCLGGNAEDEGPTSMPLGRYWQEEYGRNYSVLGRYESMFPSDEDEKHHFYRLGSLLARVLRWQLFRCPASMAGANVLDMGTGTGQWALNVGRTDPSCRVTGVDIAPVEAGSNRANVKFEVQDLESGWPRRRPYSFIFGRQLGGSIVDWPRLIRQCYDNLENGGWIEFHELDSNYYVMPNSTPGRKVLEMSQLLSLGLSNLGRRLDVADYIRELLQQQGFEHLTHDRIAVPIGMWPPPPPPHTNAIDSMRNVGLARITELEFGIEGLTLKPFCKGLGWTPSQVHLFVADVTREVVLGGTKMASTL